MVELRHNLHLLTNSQCWVLHNYHHERTPSTSMIINFLILKALEIHIILIARHAHWYDILRYINMSGPFFAGAFFCSFLDFLPFPLDNFNLSPSVFPSSFVSISPPEPPETDLLFLFSLLLESCLPLFFFFLLSTSKS